MRFVGDAGCMATVDDWYRTYPRQKHKAIVIYGNSGIGKTFLVSYLCHHYGITLYEVDTTTGDSIGRSIVNIRNDQRVFRGAKMVASRVALSVELAHIVDKTLLQLLAHTKTPLFCTYTGDTVPLRYRKVARVVKMSPPTVAQTEKFLMELQSAHHITASPSEVASIAKSSSGDLMHASIALQHHSHHKDMYEDLDVTLGKIFTGTWTFSFEEMERVYGKSIHKKLQTQYPSKLLSMQDIAEVADGFSASQIVSEYHRSTVVAKFPA